MTFRHKTYVNWPTLQSREETDISETRRKMLNSAPGHNISIKEDIKNTERNIFKIKGTLLKNGWKYLITQKRTKMQNFLR
jgi:hypothetical protein